MKMYEVMAEAEVRPYEKLVIDTNKAETILRQFCSSSDNLIL